MNKLIALILLGLGNKPNISKFIDGDTITMGYILNGNLGIFKYPLPNWYIIKIFKTLSYGELKDLQ